MSGSPWALLGIASTTDALAIRRAYARTLKTIDVDSDPAAFIALRNALHAAQMHAAQAAAQVQQPVLADGPCELAPEAESAPEDEAIAAERPAWVDDIEAIQALIYGDQPREAIFAEVGTRAERLLNGPEMAEIQHAAQIEQWAAQVILSGIPRSNGLLLPALQRFGWRQRAEQWDYHPAIRAIVDRYIDCQYLNDLRDGRSPNAAVFRRIYEGAKPRSGQLAAAEEFLNMVRRDFSTLPHEFPADSLAAWDKAIARRNNRLIARWGRARNAFWVKFVRFARRYKLNYIGGGLAIAVAILLGLGAIVATNGFALIFILAGLASSRRK
ncbi:hypothetical protein [Sphingomonas sp. KR3-1]|uniref:hypothetical protein n=1 Tax=Sphingomonas sp. KR3-1 TaxID=3156611 RepID=UPI0032B5A753